MKIYEQYLTETNEQLLQRHKERTGEPVYIGIIKKIPLKLTRLVSGVLLAITGIPLIIYGLDIPYPEIMRWLIPPLS